MKKLMFVGAFLIATLTGKAQTWNEWFEQDKTQKKYLTQQIAKLQLYLTYLKKGYRIVNDGLTTIGDWKRGDFQLHTRFFNRLQTVNAVVKQYAKIAGIVAMQKDMTATKKKYLRQFAESGSYQGGELKFLNKVLDAVVNQAADDVQELIVLLSDGKWEMDDQERLHRIDKLHSDMAEKQAFLVNFCQRTMVQAVQRRREITELKKLEKLY